MRLTICTSLILLAVLAWVAAADPAGARHTGQSAAIEAIRDYALSYTKRLPSFICTLTTRHVTREPNAVNVPHPEMTTLEELISFDGNKEVRKIVRVEGAQSASVKGPFSQGEFGILLLDIFDPRNGAELKWSRESALERRQVDVVAFHVPQASGYVLVQSTGEIRVPFEGVVYADHQTHSILRIQAKCKDIPAKAEYAFVELTLDYRAARVAGREYTLPSHFVLNFVNTKEDRQNINEGRFSDYRQFSTDVSIRYEDGKQ